MAQTHDPKIIVALDYADADSAFKLVSQLDPNLCRLKVGKELFTAAGPQFVEKLTRSDFGVFLDLKFHDIPNTVAKACSAASNLGVWMLNVHASGGMEMMQAAKQAVDSNSNNPLLIAVTVLTSMNQQTLNQIGIHTELATHVLNLATLTQQAGLDGVVCSAMEAKSLRTTLGNDFCLVTPGIRPTNASKDDQSRIVTPKDALELGSSYLVIGRPITQAANPLAALEAIHAECTA
ncbi:MAG: orotidine 5'-phosphate decarboxylase [Methylotenera sp. 24-45-7]|jgi:orotidine-5'-phosphate decarboxylase|nr:MAG: orotidine 5'-phosphate decarboxylase [Mehylophilales bacterium 35-46-6]OYZ39202.1 MAG: orotidine 5'-phosphate decarboxylase [Methylotenera sp. 24-45-7]OZA09046.1 MAG: orotidine 5'-phosphate decarboxylase [Methylotenera sp. 17-45-7]OZA53828.1 MAG: orotidine 5'-phosphate decarboxylase [Methylophilales bacterium 39-45-7]HQS44787.1 orotidine-5'-phosphate decarboxylase [Methylotenera sp.]